MKIQSFEYMRTMYGGNRDLDPDDLEERKRMFTKYKYSVIIEGGHMEFDNLHKWINEHIGANATEEIYYGKTDYNYGFAEFFMTEKIHEEKFRQVVPNIYTVYPDAYPPLKICKSNGSDTDDIEYDPKDKDAIIYPVDKNP